MKPTQREMDIFEQQEMSKSRPQVKSKLNKWYDWLINYLSKPIKDGASKAFKTFKDKVMGLYNRVTGSTQRSAGPSTAGRGAASTKPKPFKPIELEQAFGRDYRSYRIKKFIETEGCDESSIIPRVINGVGIIPAPLIIESEDMEPTKYYALSATARDCKQTIVYAYRNRKTRIVRRKGGFKVFRIKWLAVN